MSKQIIRTANAPMPLAGYSQGVRANGFVFVAGQGAKLPIRSKGMKLSIAVIAEA